MGVSPLIFNLLKLSIQRPSGYHAQSKGGSWLWCAGWVRVGCVLVVRCRGCWLGNILVCFHWDENPPWVSGAACDPEPAPRGARAWGPPGAAPPARRLWFGGGAVGRGASPQIRGRCGRADCATSDLGAVRSGGVHCLRALRGRAARAALPTMASSSSSAGAAGAAPLPVVASSLSVIIGLGQNGYGHGVCVCVP